MPPTTLLALMLATYAIPIAFVYYKYSTSAAARSISSIITSKEPFITITDNNAPPPVFTMFQTRHFIAACMLLMAVFTIAYEYQRCVTQHTQWSLFAITALLIGIFGVIFIPEHESTHYIFAATAFFAILGFMVGHTYYGTASDTAAYDTLRILLYAQFLFMVVTIIGVIQDAPIFATEALFLLNFAVFYLYLHGEHYTFSISMPSPSPSSSTR